MAIYPYRCITCGYEGEQISTFSTPSPVCPECGKATERLLGVPAMFKFKGEGGYPSRRKFTKGSAPGTTRTTKVWGDYDPSDKSINYMGTK